MVVSLRNWDAGDESFLWEMLYQAIHVAEGDAPPPRSVLDDPPIRHYLSGFGSGIGDDAVIACEDDRRIGAAFCRRFTADDPSYGFISEDIPEVGMAVLQDCRGRGVGRAMLTELLSRYPSDDPVPLSVALSLDEAFRVLEAIEDARLALRERGAAPGLQDELATVIRMLHGKLGFDEGGVQ